MNNQKKIEKFVDAIPHDGEWHHRSNRDSFINAAKHLEANGVRLDVIEEVLDVLYCAVSSEYGE